MTEITADRVTAIRNALVQLEAKILKGDITRAQVREDPITVLTDLGLTPIEVMLVLREEDYIASLECEGRGITCLVTRPCVRSIQPGPFRVVEPPGDTPSTSPGN